MQSGLCFERLRIICTHDFDLNIIVDTDLTIANFKVNCYVYVDECCARKNIHKLIINYVLSE